MCKFRTVAENTQFWPKIDKWNIHNTFVLTVDQNVISKLFTFFAKTTSINYCPSPIKHSPFIIMSIVEIFPHATSQVKKDHIGAQEPQISLATKNHKTALHWRLPSFKVLFTWNIYYGTCSGCSVFFVLSFSFLCVCICIEQY